MRLQVTTPKGIRYGGRTYRQGEELEVENTRNGRVWAAALVANRRARKFEPVVLGTEPPAPSQPSAPAAPMTTETWMQPSWAASEPQAQPAAEPQEEPPATLVEGPIEPETNGEEQQARRGRHRRRDLRAEE